MTPEITCCFTGHRPQRLPWGDNEADLRCQAVKARLTRAVAEAYDRGYRHFLCGMAQGADLYFCQAVLNLKAQHPGVTLEAAIPYEGQADHWPPADRLRRQRLPHRGPVRLKGFPGPWLRSLPLTYPFRWPRSLRTYRRTPGCGSRKQLRRQR